MKRASRSMWLSPFAFTIPLGMFLIGFFVGSILIALLVPDSAFAPPPPSSIASSSSSSTTTTTITTTTTTTSAGFACAAASLSWSDESISSENTTIAAASGLSPSMALDATNEPFIAFARAIGDTLWVTRRSVGAWTEVEVDPQDVAWESRSISSALVDAQPAVAYGTAASRLCFVQWNGTAWEIQDFESGGTSASMAVDADGHPRIAHYATPNLRLYSRSAGPIWSTEIVAASDFYFAALALTFLGDTPAIGFQDATGFAPLNSDYGAYVWNGTHWNGFIVESFATIAALHLSVAARNDTLVMVYETLPVGVIALAYAELDGGTWTSESIPGTNAAAGIPWPSVAVIRDCSTVMYCNGTGAECSVATRSSGGGWSVDVSYASIENNRGTALIDFDGYPAGAFKFGTDINSVLKYIEASPI